MAEFSGLLVATLTPFDASGRVDYALLTRHTVLLADSGVQGICPCGTTGEWLYLSIGEKARIIEAAVDSASDRIPVMAGVAALNSKEIRLVARAAESAGAGGVFLPPPIYYPASDDVIYDHYAGVKEICSLPIFAYNIPSHAANQITLSCVERLVTDGVIAGIKDSTASAERVGELVRQFGDRITVLAASDSFATEGRKLGARGFISALANVWPKAFRRIWEGEESLQPAIDAARKAVKEAGGIPALKYLMELRGLPFGITRSPSTEMTDARKDFLSAALRKAAESGLD